MKTLMEQPERLLELGGTKGVQPVLLTGDHAHAAQAIAGKLGITDVHALKKADASNKAVQPTSKLESLTVSKDTFLYNQKFTEQFLDFLKDVIIDNDLKFEKIKEFKVVVGLRNIFVDDSQPPGEVFTVYYETILDKKTIMYFFNVISNK